MYLTSEVFFVSWEFKGPYFSFRAARKWGRLTLSVFMHCNTTQHNLAIQINMQENYATICQT